MRAIVFDDRLEFRADYPEPGVSEGEALVKVRYAGICATDLEITKGYMGFKGVLGHEFAGVVEQCHDKGLAGRRVTGEINLFCGRCPDCLGGLGNHCPQRTVLGIYGKDGAFADYVMLPVKNLHFIPESLADEEAVFIEPVAAAYEILEQVPIGKKTKVAVIGDGRLGLLISQVVSLTGCSMVSIGRHREKLALLEARGIDTRIGIEGLCREFDVVIDAAGSATGIDEAIKIVRPRGAIVLKTTAAAERKIDLNKIVIDEIRLVGSRCGPFKPAIEALSNGMVDVKPLIARVFSLEDGVQAFGYASKKGVLKVLLKVC